MSNANRGLLITADAHVAENDDLRARLPEGLRERMPLMVLEPGGDFDVETNGKVTECSCWKELSPRDRDRDVLLSWALLRDVSR